MNLKREVEKGERIRHSTRAKKRESAGREAEKRQGEGRKKEEKERGEGESVRKGRQGERRPEIER